jgi:uncharacterized protein (TIGR02996 family)
MLDAFFKELAGNPNDWQVRGVFADWCEDNGRVELAECLRWMVRHKKRPYTGLGKSYTWFNADMVKPGLGDPESDIPGVLFDCLTGGHQACSHRAFPSLREAEEAFHAAWAQARTKGWRPKG